MRTIRGLQAAMLLGAAMLMGTCGLARGQTVEPPRDAVTALISLDRVSLVTTRPISYKDGTLAVGTETSAGVAYDFLRLEKSGVEWSLGVVIPAEGRSVNRFSFNPQVNLSLRDRPPAIVGTGYDVKRNSVFAFLGYRLK